MGGFYMQYLESKFAYFFNIPSATVVVSNDPTMMCARSGAGQRRVRLTRGQNPCVEARCRRTFEPMLAWHSLFERLVFPDAWMGWTSTFDMECSRSGCHACSMLDLCLSRHQGCIRTYAGVIGIEWAVPGLAS